MSGAPEVLAFDGKVVLVTGAGNGLGRAHALALARRGARVVVNDFGVTADGAGRSEGPAAAVVDEIRSAGGEAVADTSSVATEDGGRAGVDLALSSFGRIDAVVHNAGIVGRCPIGELPEARLRAMVDVHLLGGFHVARAAWPHFEAQRSGRLVLTTSGVGFFGMAGNAAYAAAKMGLVGLMRSLALEGEASGVKVNALAPFARTRMAGDAFGELTDKIDPEQVSAALVLLAHDDCPVSGRVISAGGGRVAELFLGATQGWFTPALTPEELAGQFDQVLDRRDATEPVNAMAEVAMTAAHFDRPTG